MDLTQISQDTIEMAKEAFRNNPSSMNSELLAKAGFTQSLGIVGYNLEAPSKKLYPVLAPMRNRIPRSMAPIGATAVNWRVITGINTANVKASVGFGQRNSSITYATADKSATYRTIGLDSKVEFESIWQSRNFEDVRAYDALATLQSLMIEEEKLILGGNITALGTPTGGAIVNTAGTDGAIAANTAVHVKVSALNLFGYLNGAKGNGGSDANGETTATADLTVTTPNDGANTHKATVTWTQVRGAFAYNIYVGTTNANHAYLTTVTVNKCVVTTLTATSANVPNGADTTASTTDYDGLYAQLMVNGAGTTIKDLNGASLTADNAGGIVEFDDVLRTLWDNKRIGPTLILVNSADALAVTKAIGGSSNLAYRVMLTDGRKDVVGGIFVAGYLNKFTSSLTPGSPDIIPLLIHPYLPPGNIWMLSERLPYPNNNIPNVFEMDVLQEYTDFQFATTTRNYEHGVYCHEVLKVYFPSGCAVIRGVSS